MYKKKLPNILTLFRIAIIPFIIILSYFDKTTTVNKITAFLFALACLTDFLDGFLARTWGVQSALGRFLDPIADKLLIGSTILMLVHFDKIDIFPALAIICREILVSGLREFLAELRVSVPVSNLSKVKTGFQMISIFLLLLGNQVNDLEYFYRLGKILSWAAAILTILTGYAYFKSALKYIREQENG